MDHPWFYVGYDPRLGDKDTTPTLTDDVWHFLVGTYDGVIQTLYVDGRPAANREWAQGDYIEGAPIRVGGFPNGANFTGQIDDVRIYNRALSSAEVAQLYGEGRPMPPSITGINPASGPIGTGVTISGGNFNPVPANNIVFFGAVKATVTAATASELAVTVPAGATCAPISVTNPGGLTGYSAVPFVPTFGCGGNIDQSSFVAVATLYLPGTHPAIRKRLAAIGDMDGDGKPDLAVASSDGNTYVFKNTSSPGQFSFEAGTTITGGGDTYNVVVQDLDGDGKPDLALASAPGHLFVYRNITTEPGPILFSGPLVKQTGGLSTIVAAGDLDKDGKSDLVVANTTDNTVSVYLNQSTPGVISFADKQDFQTDEYVQWVAISDLDGDGKLDIAAANRRNAAPSTVSVLHNKSTPGTLGFTKLPSFEEGYESFEACSLQIGDLDADGKPDLAVGNVLSGRVSILRNTSPSADSPIFFAPEVPFLQYPPSSFMVSLGDLNGDGKLDLVVGHDTYYRPGTPGFSVLQNTATVGIIDTTSFAGPVNFQFSGCTLWVSNGDLDGDGRADIVVVDECTSTVTVYQNRMCSESLPDTTPPTVTCPPNRTLAADASGQVRIPDLLAEVIATDDRTPPEFLTKSQTPAAGTSAGLGNHVINITVTDAAGNSSPCRVTLTVLPTGRMVYTVSHEELRLREIATGITKVVPLGDLAKRWKEWPSWHPSGFIVFCCADNSGVDQIYAISPDGTDLRQITHTPGHSVDPGVSPDGKSVAFQSPLYGTLHTINWDGSDLLDRAVHMDLVSWAPSRRIIASNWAMPSYACDLFYFDVTSGQVTTIKAHHDGRGYLHGSLSPDGSKLAVSRYNGVPNDFDVVLMNADGTDEVNLTGDWPGRYHLLPKWSPDGKYLVLLSKRSGNVDIWMWVRSGGESVNLTNTPEDEEGPVDILLADPNAPVVICPQNIVVGTDPGQCSAVVNYPAPVVSGGCPPVTVTCVPPSGSVFQKGDTWVTCTAQDATGNPPVSCQFKVTVEDGEPPTIIPPQPIIVSTDPGKCFAVVNFAVQATDNCLGVTVVCQPPSGTEFAVGITPVICTVTDAADITVTRSFTVTVNDIEPPRIISPASIVVSTDPGRCEATFNPVTATVTDNCGATVTGVRSDGKALSDPYPKGVTTISWTATDAAGNSASCTQTVTVNDTENPAVGPIAAPVDPVPISTQISVSANATDNCDLHTALWQWGDGTSSGGTVNGTTVSGSHTYMAAGVYTLVLTVMDTAGNASDTAMYQYVVVYDPNGGFVTGGGWITSPAGAYQSNPSLTGKATFGFNSKYKNGATVPTGQTQFDFHAAGLNFHSEEYEWLVISGAKARYKGSGTINGSGDYGFVLIAIDGQVNGGGGTDKFRIKIWQKAPHQLVYDNQLDAPEDTDPTTVLGGGSIVIHKEN